jgi:aromatic prenyltransferase
MNTSAKPSFDLSVLFSDLARFAEIAEVPFNSEAMRTVIDLFADVYSKETIAVRTTTHPKGKRDVNFRYMAPETPHDPFERLRKADLLTLEGHPIEKVIPEVTSRFPVWWALDVAVTHGFEKIWLFFEKSVPFEDILTLSSLPASVRNYRKHFSTFAAGHVVNIIGLDFQNKSLNIYPAPFIPGTYTPARIAAVLTDLGFDVPSEEELGLVSRTLWFYYTFRWDSPTVQRISFTVYTPAEGYPIHWHPLCKRFVEQAPFRAERQMFIYSPTYSRTGNYLKIEADYQGRLEQIFQRYPMQKSPLDC